MSDMSLYLAIALIPLAGSLLAGLSSRIEERVQFPVRVVDTPLESVVRGAGQCLENFGELQGLFVAG